MSTRRRDAGGTGWGRVLPILVVLVVLIVVVFQSDKSKHRYSANSLQSPVSADTDKWEVFFSPHGGCTDAIVDAISGAKRTVRVQAYSFTSWPIVEALIDAKQRRVDVQVILDKSNETARAAADDELLAAHIPTYIDAEHAIAHNKIMIIDGTTVITGSFNFTNAAEERNAENLLLIQSSELAERYTENWQEHKEHSLLQAYRE